MIYAGIGSRSAPYNVISSCFQLGKYFALKKFILRSGGADGCDHAFEAGCDVANGRKQIFLPWKKYNNRHRLDPFTTSDIPTSAFGTAERLHPAWDKCSSGAKRLLARNMCQINGPGLNDPVDFVLCYTVDETKGGTSLAIKYARELSIPVYNLYKITMKEAMDLTEWASA